MIYALTKNCYGLPLVPRGEAGQRGRPSRRQPLRAGPLVAGRGAAQHLAQLRAENRPLSQERLRLFYAVGVAVELENSLRALSKATQKDRFAVTMAKRVQIARLRARQLARATKDPDLVALARAASGAKLSLSQAKSLAGIADLVAKAAQAFADKHDGSKLAAIDRFLPKSRGSQGAIPGRPAVEGEHGPRPGQPADRSARRPRPQLQSPERSRTWREAHHRDPPAPALGPALRPRDDRARRRPG